MIREAQIASPSRRGRGLRRVSLVMLMLAASLSLASQAPDKKSAGKKHVSPELARLSDALQHGNIKNQTIQVIVQFKQRPTQDHIKKMSKLGGRHLQQLNLVKGGVFNIPLSALATLAEDSDVAYVSPNRSVKGASSDAFEETVGGDVAHSYGFQGAGVGVAVIDSGISDHPDLHDPVTGLSRVVYSESFVPGTDTNDGYGHGTHVAGIIGGNGSRSAGAIVGVAPQVNLINLKVLDSSGAGSDSYVIAAIERAISLKDTYNIRVLNLSLGRPVYESFTQDPLCQAAEAAWRAGLVVSGGGGKLGS